MTRVHLLPQGSGQQLRPVQAGLDLVVQANPFPCDGLQVGQWDVSRAGGATGILSLLPRVYRKVWSFEMPPSCDRREAGEGGPCEQDGGGQWREPESLLTPTLSLRESAFFIMKPSLGLLLVPKYT